MKLTGTACELWEGVRTWESSGVMGRNTSHYPPQDTPGHPRTHSDKSGSCPTPVIVQYENQFLCHAKNNIAAFLPNPTCLLLLSS
ncbi:hypothetical protein Pmani_029216 [Petrolisthes manimaculis]|uniref:Uncharacterized protein n=1 Tax=Petrolisthes manimaculis TaxID=1843537 RepID=A0AAE1P007_9EUCA|nr:hypothetical protein Pmani_029216 [Petrolisthes manimaculis]